MARSTSLNALSAVTLSLLGLAWKSYDPFNSLARTVAGHSLLRISGSSSGSITTNVASRTTSPPPGAAGEGGVQPTLNENLRNLGRFFKRSDGAGAAGFGGFGR